MRDGLIIHDDADKTPAPPPGRHPLAPISGAEFERPRRRLPPQVWLIITVTALAPVVALLIAVWRGLEDLFARQPWLPDALLTLLLVGALLLLGSGVAGALSWGRARLLHARVIRTAHGAPVDVGAALGVHPLVAEQQQLALYHAQAPYALHPNLSTLSYGGKQAEKAEAPALPEPGLGLVPGQEWLSWIDQTPHLMIAGRTKAGKTTLALAVLGERVRAGELLCVLDPHDQPGKWFGAQAIGGGRDYDAIYAALDGLLAEMDRRYKRYDAGEARFDRLTVLIDEVPAIVLRDKKRWATFASQLGSEARKVNMSMVLLTQSPLVRDIEISSVMRNNFTRVALGDQAPDLVREESDHQRRRVLDELLRGQEHPAAMEYRGEVHLLDTSGVPALAAQRAVTRLWLPPAVAAQPSLLEVLRQARKGGWTRDEVRASGLSFDNDMWAAAGE